jgi:hypothetical protein
MEENQAYTRGVQWSAADQARQEAREKPTAPFNDTFKVVHAISNREMVSRLIPKVFGRNRAQEGIAEVLDESCRWQRQTSNSEHYESMGFRSATMGGYGCVHKFWDPVAANGEGLVRDEDVPIWEMLWPVRAREMNLSDRRWHVRGRWMDTKSVDEAWGSSNPAVRKGIKRAKMMQSAASTDTSSMGDRSAASSRSGFGWEMVRSGQFATLASEETFVVEFEEREVEFVWRVALPKRFWEWVAFVKAGGQIEIDSLDPQTQQPTKVPITHDQFLQMPPEAQDQIQSTVLAETEILHVEEFAQLAEIQDLWEELFGEEFVYYHKIGKEVVNFAIIVNNKVAESGTRPYGFSYEFITAFPFETRDGQDFYGVVDIIKGPQDVKNALISSMTAMYMSSPKGILVVEKSAYKPSMADQIASTSGLMVVEDGWHANPKHSMIQAPSYPPMLGPLLDITNAGVTSPLGMSSIDLGNQDDLRRVSGKVVQASQLASNVIVALLFDSMRKFRKAYGLMNVRFMRYMYSPEQLLKIVGDEKAQDIPTDQSLWDDILHYDITIDEQPSSTTELMELLDRLTVTGELTAMRDRGDIDFEGQLKLMPVVPASIKRELLDGKKTMDQLAAVNGENQNLKSMIQQMYTMFDSSPEGKMLLQNFIQEWQYNQFSQQNFSQDGVPQAQGQQVPQ